MRRIIVKTVLSWIFCILFILSGIASIVLGFSYITGLFLILAGVLLFPPLFQKITVPGFVRFIAVEACLCLALVLYMPTTDSTLKTASISQTTNSSEHYADQQDPPSATNSPAPSASSKPGSSPTAQKPGADPSSTASIQLLSSTAKVESGKTASISVLGKPSTGYSITVLYSSEGSSANIVQSKTSDASGKVAFTWEVGSAIKPGAYPIVIAGGGQSKTFCFTVA